MKRREKNSFSWRDKNILNMGKKISLKRKESLHKNRGTLQGVGLVSRRR